MIEVFGDLGLRRFLGDTCWREYTTSANHTIMNNMKSASRRGVKKPGRGVGTASTNVTQDRMGDGVQNETVFYSKAENYWREVAPTVDGMLGGYGKISNIDIDGSKKFLQKFLGGEGKTGNGCALDCGAGIGRITKRLLLPLFNTVDLVDVTQEFLDQAKVYLGDDSKRVENYFCLGLQDFIPQDRRYDVIWIQWVIGHLTDDHLVEFLHRCRGGLRPEGIIVIKDNVAYEGVIPDDVDSSVCRELALVKSLVTRAGLTIVCEEQQMNFPDEIYQVHQLALR
uniref:N-terminal Xaa-Pro-Lys N-methyltransferase 1 isoform X2 n=1 Tax=Oncorhynchus gorbuscha TaxID=8017 RepID=UPI001EAF0337|nr:N-terminal Xaa-Pro-Lys N-methyltransferase 1 isoform X2 [Oncorhynchus gorbuscha]